MIPNEKNPAAVALGKLGGSVSSERKAASSRANGMKNKENAGRPLKPLGEFECRCPPDAFYKPAVHTYGRLTCPRGRAERRREQK